MIIHYTFSLHSTMFLLIQTELKEIDKLLKPLHSTMFLLIRNAAIRGGRTCNFTFHNVSINTQGTLYSCRRCQPLHSTMFLLIRLLHQPSTLPYPTLHSTMFLLILNRSSVFFKSILSLHSTMFLLIPVLHIRL